ncbi:MAG: hypothetical protein A2542_00620 [Parcubacteria group bacterium RIFOXYD2_FULL_52_8]|nr:MAG: hypothetical protein A2542_00620 [Parcubacteria group bacterium RIFOXYD2_FULL_52_8]
MIAAEQVSESTEIPELNEEQFMSWLNNLPFITGSNRINLAMVAVGLKPAMVVGYNTSDDPHLAARDADYDKRVHAFAEVYNLHRHRFAKRDEGGVVDIKYLLARDPDAFHDVITAESATDLLYATQLYGKAMGYLPSARDAYAAGVSMPKEAISDDMLLGTDIRPESLHAVNFRLSPNNWKDEILDWQEKLDSLQQRLPRLVQEYLEYTERSWPKQVELYKQRQTA